jgi:hypothetical protein
MSMIKRVASCCCGQLRAETSGEPFRISVCHCLACQRRSGSTFATQARWQVEDVTLTGEASTFRRIGDSGGGATFRFCPTCGETISFSSDAFPESVAIPVGAFADPDFPAPKVSVYEERKHGWVTVEGDDVERFR